MSSSSPCKLQENKSFLHLFSKKKQTTKGVCFLFLLLVSNVSLHIFLKNVYTHLSPHCRKKLIICKNMFGWFLIYQLHIFKRRKCAIRIVYLYIDSWLTVNHIVCEWSRPKDILMLCSAEVFIIPLVKNVLTPIVDPLL